MARRTLQTALTFFIAIGAVTCSHPHPPAQASEDRPAEVEEEAKTPPPLESTEPLASMGKAPVVKKLPRKNEKSPLGTNLTMMRDYTSEYPFVDVMKKSREWFMGKGA